MTPPDSAQITAAAMDAALQDLAATAHAHDLPWQDAWHGPLTQLLSWLARFSRRTNLVGDHRPSAVVEEHLLETLVVAAAATRAGLAPQRIIDVGAGAGLEGLLLALWAPSARLVAVEPRRKRADFIELVADAMGVGQRVTVVRAQVPAWRPTQVFDLATSRATFAPLVWRAHGARLIGPAGGVVVHAAVTAAGGQSADLNERAGSSGVQALATLAVPGRPRHCVQVFGPQQGGLES